MIFHYIRLKIVTINTARMQNSELLWDYDPNMNVVLLNEYLPCAWMWLDMVLPSKYVAEERRWPGRVLLVFTMQLPAARPASPSWTTLILTQAKQINSFVCIFLANINHGSFLTSLNLKSSIWVLSTLLLLFSHNEIIILSTIYIRYYNQLQSVR